MLRDVLILAVSIIILSLLIFLLYTSYVGSEIPRKAKVIVIFRMDDIQPNWKFHALRKGVDLFIEEKVPITLGVIPNVGGKLKVSEDPPLSSYIRRLLLTKSNLVEVALHGLTHDIRTHVSGKSEFAGLTSEEQFDMIVKGKKILEESDAEVRVFIPPFDTYDNNTIKALSRADIRILSARYMDENESTDPIIVDGVLLVHASQSLVLNWSNMTLNSYDDLIRSFDDVYDKGGVFVFEMHYYHFNKQKNLRLVRNLIHHMKAKEGVAFMKLGEFGEGYLNGTIRKESEIWIIGED